MKSIKPYIIRSYETYGVNQFNIDIIEVFYAIDEVNWIPVQLSGKDFFEINRDGTIPIRT